MPVAGQEAVVRESNRLFPEISRFDVVCAKHIGLRSDGQPFMCWTRMDFIAEDGTNHGQRPPDGAKGWWTCFRGHRLRKWKWLADERSHEDSRFKGHGKGRDHRVSANTASVAVKDGER